MCAGADSRVGLRLNCEIELCGKPHGPEHSQEIFAEALLGFADGSHYLLFEVRPAIYIIDYLLCEGVVKHSVNSEVSSGGIFAGIGELYGGRVSTVCVAGFGSESSDFDLSAFEKNNNYAELRTDLQCAAKELCYLCRRSIGSNIIVISRAAEQHITDTAAGQQGLVAVSAETPNYLYSCLSVSHSATACNKYGNCHSAPQPSLCYFESAVVLQQFSASMGSDYNDSIGGRLFAQ